KCMGGELCGNGGFVAGHFDPSSALAAAMSRPSEGVVSMEASLIAVVGSGVAGAVGAALGWIILNFVGRPGGRYFDFLGEVIRRVTEFANVRPRWQQTRDGELRAIDIDPNDMLYEKEDVRLNEAKRTFRDLASQMRAFAENESLAMWLVVRLEYNPLKAS